MSSISHESALKEMSLKQLLDGVGLAQRQDIHAYAGGHLNEANLAKPPEKASHKSWKNALKEIPSLVPRGEIPKTHHKTTDLESMSLTMANFSLGTLGHMALTSSKDFAKGKTNTLNNEFSDLKRTPKEKDEEVYIEELNLPEMMFTRAEYSLPQTEVTKPAYLGWSRDLSLLQIQHEFLPGHQEAVTKKDHYQSLKVFESDVLKKSDIMEREVLSGYKAVHQHEVKLKQDLESLHYNAVGPNFHRLQVYSTTFEELIGDSSTFGYILSTIKKEYDNFVSALLDEQSGKHQALHDQVKQLTSHGTSNNLLNNEAQRVKKLEQEAKHLLQENERLRKELAVEEKIVAHSVKEPEPKVLLHHIEKPNLELVDQVEELHATILERLANINDLRTLLRTRHVPSSVCNHLQQCIKDTEVETQRMMGNKEYFERSIKEMESELQEIIDSADTTEKDAKHMWQKVNAVKADSQGHILMEDISDENEDENKWNWYIS